MPRCLRPLLVLGLAVFAIGLRARAEDRVFRTIDGEPIRLPEFHRFVGFELRADPRFEEERSTLYQEIVIRDEARKRSIEIATGDVERRFVELDDEAREKDSRGLNAILAEQDVDRAEFLRRLEAALLLERIVAREFDLGSGRVPEEKQNVWLQDRMSKARIVAPARDGTEDDLLATVDGRPVTLEEYGRRLFNSLAEGSKLWKSLEQQFIAVVAVRRHAVSRGVVLSEADVNAAVDAREKLMQGKPGMADVGLDEVLAETGGSVAQLKASQRFRTRLLLERLVDEVEFKGADLWLFYRSHLASFDRLYGEQVLLSTVFLKAGEQGAFDAGFVPRTFETAMADLTAVRSILESGNGKFDDAARARSEHSSAQQGGFMGTVGVASSGIGELARQVLAARDRGELKVGDLLGPIQLVDGVHLVMVNGFVPRKRFEDLVPEVRKHAMNELLRGIVANAVIETPSALTIPR